MAVVVLFPVAVWHGEAAMGWTMWGVADQAPKLQSPRFPVLLVVVAVPNFGTVVDLHLRLVGLPN